MIRRGAALLLLVVGAAATAQAAWIPCKAALAQLLLGRAWDRSRTEGTAVPPWPWADTHPVARLSAPRLAVERLVLAGSSGRTLAFGPGHWSGSAAPGSTDNVVIAGHRDTHFAFLRDLVPGDELWLETPSGARQRYHVEEARVAHQTEGEWMEPTGRAELTLITCFPFGALVPGGPLRYVVRARADPTP